jgi:hypothetical protein
MVGRTVRKMLPTLGVLLYVTLSVFFGSLWYAALSIGMTMLQRCPAWKHAQGRRPIANAIDLQPAISPHGSLSAGIRGGMPTSPKARKGRSDTTTQQEEKSHEAHFHDVDDGCHAGHACDGHGGRSEYSARSELDPHTPRGRQSIWTDLPVCWWKKG